MTPNTKISRKRFHQHRAVFYSMVATTLYFSQSVAQSQGPGGVTAGLETWLRADDGVFQDSGSAPASDGTRVEQWQNAGAGGDFSQSVGTKQPDYVADGVNFNPTLQFRNADETLLLSNSIDIEAEATIYAIFENTGSGFTARTLFGSDASSTDGTEGTSFVWKTISFFGDNQGAILSQHPTVVTTNCNVESNSVSITEQFAMGGMVTSNATVDVTHYLDGKMLGDSRVNNCDLNGITYTQQYGVGGPTIDSSASKFYGGAMAEIVAFDRGISATERARLESYLALKYGIQLDQVDDEQNYLASDGSIIYPARTSHSGHANMIAGIGRDDNSALHQKQSQSTLTGSVVAMYLGDVSGALPTTNADHPSGFTLDKSFLIWGNNDAPLALAANYNGGSLNRINRAWRVAKTGTLGEVTLSIPTTVSPDLSHVIINTTSSFAFADRAVALTQVGSHYEAVVQFNHGDYFTFVTDPGLDQDLDGITDVNDLDIDNDGIPNSTEGTGDLDNDDIANAYDLDSDNDGILDVVEAGGTDSNGDGEIDAFTDNNFDGMHDTANLPITNSDSDASPDYLDLDSDNDGISDLVESGNAVAIDSDGDGVLDLADNDGDGLQDSVDGDDFQFGSSGNGVPAPQNTSGGASNTPDYTTPTSDGASLDRAIAGLPMGAGTADADSDGVIDNPADSDGDGIPDSADTSSSFGGTEAPFEGFAAWQASTTGAGSLPTDNADGDCLNDLLEYALGSDPSTGFRVYVPELSISAGIQLSYTSGVTASYKRPTGLVDVTYTLEGSPDLTTWTPITGGTTSPITGGENVSFNSLESHASQNATFGFLRIRVDLASPAETAYTCISSWTANSISATYQTFGQNVVNRSTFVGVIDSVSGDVLNVATSAGPYSISNSLTTSDPYYVEIIDGAHEGHRFDLNHGTTTSNTIGIDLSSSLNTSTSLPASLAGAQFVVRRHKTLDDVFLKAAFSGTGNPATADQLLFFNGTGYEGYYLLDAASLNQWTLGSDFTLADQGGRIVAPGEGCLVRIQQPGLTSTLFSFGQLRENDFRINLNTGFNLISNGYPLTQTPDDLGLSTSNGFTGGTDATSSSQILTWLGDDDSSMQGFNGYFLLDFPPTLQYWTGNDDVTLTNENNTGISKKGRSIFLRILSPVNHRISAPTGP